MKKILLFSVLLTGSLVFNDAAHAEELSGVNEQSVDQKEQEIIYFDGNQGDVLITDDVIIYKVSDVPLIPLPSLTASKNYTENEMGILGAGEWDRLGDEAVGRESGIYPSYGGDYKVTVVQSQYGPYLYALIEDDPITDITVRNFSFSKAGVYDMVFEDISGYVDGDNNQAEFFIRKSTMTSTYDYISFFD